MCECVSVCVHLCDLAPSVNRDAVFSMGVELSPGWICVALCVCMCVYSMRVCVCVRGGVRRHGSRSVSMSKQRDLCINRRQGERGGDRGPTDQRHINSDSTGRRFWNREMARGKPGSDIRIILRVQGLGGGVTPSALEASRARSGTRPDQGARYDIVLQIWNQVTLPLLITT